jgi:uncharacterized protein YecA (UPF0149 family)
MTTTKELVHAMENVREALNSRQFAVACDHWLRVWDLVKQLASAEALSSVEEFDDRYPLLPESVYNWCQEFVDHLWNVAIDDHTYQPLRLQYADEFLARFPDTDLDLIQSFLQAKGESLLELGRQGEADQLFDDLVDRFPNEGRAHLARSDQYWPFGPKGVPKNHARAEELILSALSRPDLLHRDEVLERLESLYEDWGKPDQRASVAAQRAALARDQHGHPGRPGETPVQANSPAASRYAGVGRNDPCPCGSGKKFKKCCLGRACA